MSFYVSRVLFFGGWFGEKGEKGWWFLGYSFVSICRFSFSNYSNQSIAFVFYVLTLVHLLPPSFFSFRHYVFRFCSCISYTAAFFTSSSSHSFISTSYSHSSYPHIRIFIFIFIMFRRIYGPYQLIPSILLHLSYSLILVHVHITLPQNYGSVVRV